MPGSPTTHCSSLLQETWIQCCNAFIPRVSLDTAIYPSSSFFNLRLIFIRYGLSEGKANEKGLQIDAQVKKKGK